MQQSEPRIDTHGLLRELGLKEGLAIGLGTMIGAGIFVLSALAAERAGPAAALSYVLAGAICLPIALVVSELATGMPRAGGSYIFITQALGPLADRTPRCLTRRGYGHGGRDARVAPPGR
jgi:amino acid transporter